jgi:phosphate transport system substrate-binding protein
VAGIPAGLPSRLTALAVSLALIGCARAAAPPTSAPVAEHYRLIADDATEYLLWSLTREYSRQANPYAHFTIESSPPALFVERLRSGQVTLGATALVPPAPAGLRWWLTDLALDGVVVIVHPANLTTSLTLRDLRDIFSGARNHWADYGQDALGDIEVAVREEGNSARVHFDQVVIGTQRLTFNALMMPSSETMLNFVALRPGAIGYAPLASLAAFSASPEAKPRVRALAVEGVMPEASRFLSGDYPLTRSLYFIALSEPQGELRNFVLWALGPEGRAVAQSLGYGVFADESRQP